MKKISKNKVKGFTIIELVITITITGTLATIAVPKFSGMIIKSKEGSTKGSLTVLRSAVTLYYAANEGMYPPMGSPKADKNITERFTSEMVPKYIMSIPCVKLGQSDIYDSNKVFFDNNGTQNKHGWGYMGQDKGKVFVSCTNKDSKGIVISSW